MGFWTRTVWIGSFGFGYGRTFHMVWLGAVAPVPEYCGVWIMTVICRLPRVILISQRAFGPPAGPDATTQ